MKWLLENPWVVVVIAGLVAQLLKALNRGTRGAAGQEEPPPAKEFEFDDTELAERTRKIREDIRRKIEERRGQHTRPPEPLPEQPRLAPQDRSPEATPPVIMGLPELIREVMQPRAAVEPSVPARGELRREAEEIERQAALMEQLQEAEQMKAAAQRRVAFEEAISDKQDKLRTQTRGVVLDDLRDPAALRRAFILREVLGPPVALR
ncbi:MAG: hypothetical protein HYV95_02540 [Opitutae bacterium]|nr:hypothetical protein [Opitutae bacterium]